MESNGVKEFLEADGMRGPSESDGMSSLIPTASPTAYGGRRSWSQTA